RQSDANNERLPPAYTPHYSQVGGVYDHHVNGSPYGTPPAQEWVAPSARRWTPEEFARRLRQTVHDEP
ncbi:hypothetical protein FRC17_002074, partial [Serendipita sp. 399]